MLTTRKVFSFSKKCQCRVTSLVLEKRWLCHSYGKLFTTKDFTSQTYFFLILMEG